MICWRVWVRVHVADDRADLLVPILPTLAELGETRIGAMLGMTHQRA